MKRKPRYDYEPFSLKQSLIEKRDAEARQTRVKERATETQFTACICPLCGYFTNSQETMDAHHKKAHIFFPVKQTDTHP